MLLFNGYPIFSIDEILPLDEAIAQSEVVILAFPVDLMVGLLPSILDKVDQQIVVDLGSTKSQLTEAVANHPKRGRYVATHPMWGTEYSGPAAAVRGAYENKAVIICNEGDSDLDALEWTKYMYKKIGMHLLSMEAKAHDLHAAYVSHISHITSFALANTVLEKEREEDAIFELASGGFESTVRLAKSNPAMWVPIFIQNRDNVLDVLNEHIAQLRKFKACLEKENYDYLQELIENGKIKISDSNEWKGKSITYHDSCYLGRANEIYEAPRKVLESLDMELKEMKRCKSKGLCCGAGGAQMFKEEEKGDKRINTERAEEARATATDFVASACPFCNTMLSDGLKVAENQNDPAVLDIAEIIAQAIK